MKKKKPSQIIKEKSESFKFTEQISKPDKKFNLESFIKRARELKKTFKDENSLRPEASL